MDVKNDSAVLVDSLANIRLSFTAASICDTAGNLLFASNGFSIYDKYGHLVENGDSISPCAYSNNNFGQLPITQCVLFIPKPDDDTLYYLFHYSYDTLQDTRPNKLYYSVINAKANNGLGAVIDKNHVFYSGTIFSGCRMTATKHANGRDWWLVLHGFQSNVYYKFLVGKDTIYPPDIQTIGQDFQNSAIAFRGQSKFSSDGSVFATISIGQELVVMDFDRCTGEFSNFRKRWNNGSNNPSQPVSSGVGLDFSPNGKFIYTTIIDIGQRKIVQYEVDILGTIGDSVIVSYIDTTGNNENASVYTIQVSYNGKVYIACWSSQFKFLHVIHNPDLKGIACNFIYLGEPTYSRSSLTVPNLVNYILGALVGSGCDTITGIQEPRAKTQEPRVFPNPADKAFYIEMPAQGNYVFELYNEQGQLVEKRTTKQVDIINVEQLQSGVYFLTVKSPTSSNSSEGGGQRQIATVKVIVQH